jgi:hypothetical protein
MHARWHCSQLRAPNSACVWIMVAFRAGLFANYITLSSRSLDCVFGWRHDAAGVPPPSKRVRLTHRKLLPSTESDSRMPSSDERCFPIDDGYCGCDATVTIDVLARFDACGASAASSPTAVPTFTIVHATCLDSHSHERDPVALKQCLRDIPRGPAEVLEKVVRTRAVCALMAVPSKEAVSVAHRVRFVCAVQIVNGLDGAKLNEAWKSAESGEFLCSKKRK